jgi:hypothetical protein
MIDQLKRSAVLLVCLGVLFSIPIVAKTWSAHGAFPALVTGFLMIAAVFLGPLSFVVADSIETGFIAAVSVATYSEITLVLILGVVLVLAWIRSLVSGSGYSVPYMTVTGWALLGAYFCVSLVFTHTT